MRSKMARKTKEKYPGRYLQIDSPPIDFAPSSFGDMNPEYPANLVILADMAREYFRGEIFLIMTEKLKAAADANGESKRMEELTGLSIRTMDPGAYGCIFVGQIDDTGRAFVFPAAVHVDVEWNPIHLISRDEARNQMDVWPRG